MNDENDDQIVLVFCGISCIMELTVENRALPFMKRKYLVTWCNRVAVINLCVI